MTKRLPLMADMSGCICLPITVLDNLCFPWFLENYWYPTTELPPIPDNIQSKAKDASLNLS